MSKLKTALGLCMLLALAASSVAVSSAAANTAFECKKGGGGSGFTDAHCKTAGLSEFGHVSIAANTIKAVSVSDTKTGVEVAPLKLRSVQSGVELELQPTFVHGIGVMENRESGSEMWAQGTGTLSFTFVSVTKPSGKGCTVKGGSFATKELAATTKGLTNSVKFSPVKETLLAEFTIEGCSIAALNHAYSLTGSVTGQTTGATTNFTHANTTEQGTLKLAGQKAGLEGTLTISTGGSGLALT